MKNIALIPMRGGSKSIPGKNIKKIAGKPLYYWAIKSAIESEIFNEIYVSSDSDEILNKVTSDFPSVNCVKRPDELAKDDTSTEAVMLDFANQYEFDVMTLIQVTSPLTLASDFQSAWTQFTNSKADSLLTACRTKRFIWSDDKTPMNYDYKSRPRRQDFKGSLVENGAFYFTKKQILLNEKNRLGGKIDCYEMSAESYTELDEPEDWASLEKILQKRSKPNLSDFKAIVLDVDGTLTDGKMHYSSDGEQLKSFNTQDAHGLKLLKEKGYQVCIITAEDSPRVHSRINKLGIEHYFFGIGDKLPVLKEWAKKIDIPLNQIIYGGDDLGDKQCMENVGYSFCPSSARPAIQKIASYVCQERGGEGAVREFIDMLLGADE